MQYFNGSTYTESPKSAENDFIHLLACDNGTFTVSHKQSGRVFFEMPTLLIGKDDTYAYSTCAQIQKSRRKSGAIFDTVQQIYPPIIPGKGVISANAPAIFTNTLVLGDQDDLTFMCALSLPDGFYENGYEAIIRFPTGINSPEIDFSPFTGEIKRTMEINDNVTLTDEEGEVFSITSDCEFPIDTIIRQDGSIDVYIPPNANITPDGLVEFGFGLFFTDNPEH